MYRRGVVRALKDAPGIEVVGEAEDGGEALKLIAALAPAVAVVDMRMRQVHGTGVLHAVAVRGLPTRVLLLSAYADPRTVYAALAEGAAGYLSKDADDSELCDAVVAVARGATVVAPQLQEAILPEIGRQARGTRPLLSPREHEILALAASGHSQAEIAKRLYIGSATVKTYLSRAYEKLGVSDRTAAVAKALREGLLQ
jgi:two-component system nitrate/nitrite response regulator NarL